ncbi:MAG: hypothetical protein M1817_004441 [Caeruleum heppii]|nr:MAG: hypothetical protein M1817_004441 [Caeruleum heppii]
MPIKIPKGFARRKSSANGLEDLKSTPAESSFRVLERPRSPCKSFDGGSKLSGFRAAKPAAHPTSQTSRPPYPDLTAPSNRGSGGSNTNSASTGVYNDSASSTRLSSSSTVPSSTDVPLTDDNHHQRPSKAQFDSAQTPNESSHIFSLRAGGRTFSFGNKSSKSVNALPPRHDSPPPLPQPDERFQDSQDTVGRQRAMTESSYASTATPPTLDTGLDTSDFDGFAKMFDGIGKRRSGIVDSENVGGAGHAVPVDANQAGPKRSNRAIRNSSLHDPPSPIWVDRSDGVPPGPYSGGSGTSKDGLLLSSAGPWASTRATPIDEQAPQHQPSTPESTSSRFRSRSSKNSPETAWPRRAGATSAGGLRRSSIVQTRRSAVPVDDDARLVMDSMTASKFLEERSADRAKGTKSRSDGDLPFKSDLSRSPGGFDCALDPSQPPSVSRATPPLGVFDDDASGSHSSDPTTPRARMADMVRPQSELTHDNTQGGSRFPEARPTVSRTQRSGQVSANKVMTPAEFERYRRQRELSRTLSDASSRGSTEDVDLDDDEDEAERHRQLARQRRKQEAHLSVYRQQMMKVTGEQPSARVNLGLNIPGSADQPAPSARLSPGLSTTGGADDKLLEGGKSSDDEDDDVPLGILAAHGFPHKTRPPARLSPTNLNSSARPASQVGSYASGPASVAGDTPTANGRPSNLPVFARQLPQDPYFGAGLVNPSNRQSLAFGHGSGGSTYGGPGSPAPGLPPGGLVGVIAGEERARAMRRGSPNAQGGYGGPGSNTPLMGSAGAMGFGMPGPMPSIGPNGMPMMSQGEQAQFQMSQQMQQMMHMQMHWMQQMMQMQGLQPGQQPLMPPNFPLGPPGNAPALYTNGPASMTGPPSQQRAMSMLDPSSAQWHQSNARHSQYAPSLRSQVPGHQVYAPSIAPSERSSIGMPTRYRPVSTALQAPNERASRGSTPSFPDVPVSEKQGRVATMTETHHAESGRHTQSDDEEEQGWQEMKKKREKKKSTWKLKRETNNLKDMFFSGHHN